MNIYTITLSDRCSKGEAVDLSGAKAASILKNAGYTVNEAFLLPDEKTALENLLCSLCDNKQCLVLTIGGTGLSPRDITPDATLAVADRIVPGICEAMRAYGMKKTPSAMLSRAVCVQRKESLIVNLPGSPKAVEENLEVLIPVLEHLFKTMEGKPHENEIYLKK